MSATLDPDGTHGGPLVHTLTRGRAAAAGRLTWATMPERQSAGVSWKVYTGPPTAASATTSCPTSRPSRRPALLARGMHPDYPDFLPTRARRAAPGLVGPGRDRWTPSTRVAAARSAGWRAPRRLIGARRQAGGVGEDRPVRHLGRERRLLRPRRPADRAGRDAGEYLTVAALPAAAQGIRGPIGLGFRVPLLVISPFSRGGFVCSDVFDHTSILRFLERRFGVEVPNLSAWRRSVTGDLTSAFSFAQPDPRPPSLPPVVPRPRPGPHADCVAAAPVAVARGPMPVQAPGRARRPSGLAGARGG